MRRFFHASNRRGEAQTAMVMMPLDQSTRRRRNHPSFYSYQPVHRNGSMIYSSKQERRCPQTRHRGEQGPFSTVEISRNRNENNNFRRFPQQYSFRKTTPSEETKRETVVDLEKHKKFPLISQLFPKNKELSSPEKFGSPPLNTLQIVSEIPLQLLPNHKRSMTQSKSENQIFNATSVKPDPLRNANSLKNCVVFMKDENGTNI